MRLKHQQIPALCTPCPTVRVCVLMQWNTELSRAWKEWIFRHELFQRLLFLLCGLNDSHVKSSCSLVESFVSCLSGNSFWYDICNFLDHQSYLWFQWVFPGTFMHFKRQKDSTVSINKRISVSLVLKCQTSKTDPLQQCYTFIVIFWFLCSQASKFFPVQSFLLVSASLNYNNLNVFLTGSRVTDSMIVHPDSSLLLLQQDATHLQMCKVKHIHTHTRPQLSFIDTKSDMLHYDSAHKNEQYLQMSSWNTGEWTQSELIRLDLHVTLTPVGSFELKTHDLVTFCDIHGARVFRVRGSHYAGKAQRNVAYTLHVINSWPGADERSTFLMIKHDVTVDGDVWQWACVIYSRTVFEPISGCFHWLKNHNFVNN